MLSKEDNDRFNNVEPGSPLNEMAKRYWLPYLRSEMLEANGAPRKVELLGEMYVSFRGQDGSVGFFDEQCPHRGASLSLARSGDNALTCIFHGWKFDTSGKCVNTPTEANPRFCANVKLRAFPVKEAGGALWVYLGKDEPPAFPDYEYFKAPPEYRRARVGYANSNWTQNFETLLDSAHIGVLHASSSSAVLPNVSNVQANHAPKFNIVDTQYGFQVYARRERGDGQVYLRVTEYVAPFTVLNGTTRTEEARLLYMVPINNRRTAFWRFMWNLDHPQEWWRQQAIETGTEEVRFLNPDDFLSDVMDRTKENFGQDREAMARGHWSGFLHLRAEDAAVSDSVPIVDRTKENLGASDLPIARMRQRFFRELDNFAKTGIAPGLGVKGDGQGVNYSELRGTAEVIPADMDQIDFHNRVLREKRISKREAFLAEYA